ncbi:YegP family protein [Amycolatopsis sp. NPDC101161]|uniref:YegP family protein n=1 Tax=Amycolatopsis sp. NPDC101161 TaxID=3363940 RepID=UPI0037F7ECE6
MRHSSHGERRRDGRVRWPLRPILHAAAGACGPAASASNGKYRFRLKAGNGEVVAVGEAYESKSSARAGCEAVQRAAAGASIVETDS